MKWNNKATHAFVFQLCLATYILKLEDFIPINVNIWNDLKRSGYYAGVIL